MQSASGSCCSMTVGPAHCKLLLELAAQVFTGADSAGGHSAHGRCLMWQCRAHSAVAAARAFQADERQMTKIKLHCQWRLCGVRSRADAA
eukprot:364409-Chlamydomonas_euryale.AAC.15